MGKKYIMNKDGSIQEEPDTIKWAWWFENNQRTIQKTTSKKMGIMVSTVFLGIDHNFSNRGEPLVFETMIFGGEHDGWCARASTKDEAERYHKHAIGLVGIEV